MSNSKAAIIVEVADRAASLEILDGGFQVVAQGFGRLDAELDPGLYKARASIGSAVQEKIFAVEEGEKTATSVILDPVRFASPVPLNDTTTSHEYHQAAVSAALFGSPLKLGGGAAFLFSLRDPGGTPFEQTPATLPDYARSFDGFRLCRFSREPLINLDEAAERNLAYGYAILHAELDPGGYILEWSSSGSPALARPLLLAPGWDTQFFVMAEADRENALPLRPNLADCAVQMAPLGHTDYPRDRYFRLTEIGRQSLLQGRNIVEREVMNELLADKFGNPVLGLLAAHLLLLDAEPRLPLLHIILGNLGAMLGLGYPDVIALRLRVHQMEHPGQPFAADQAVSFPPLLKASWDILARQAALDDSFFPAESPCRKIADRIVDNGVWLAWRPQPTQPDDSGLLSELSHEDLHGKKWLDRERILTTLDKAEASHGEHDLFTAAKHLVKPVLREKLRQFLKKSLSPETGGPEQLGDLMACLARMLPWPDIVAKLNELDRQGAISDRLSSAQKTLIPALLMLRRQLDEGQQLQKDHWKGLIDAIQLPRSVLLENLRDLARLAGGLAMRLVEEKRGDRSKEDDKGTPG